MVGIDLLPVAESVAISIGIRRARACIFGGEIYTPRRHKSGFSEELKVEGQQ